MRSWQAFALLIAAHRRRLGLGIWKSWEYGERTPPEWSQDLILERLEKIQEDSQKEDNQKARLSDDQTFRKIRADSRDSVGENEIK